MRLEQMLGLDFELPKDKPPGFYAQIIKGMAQNVPLFDLHKELLIFDHQEHLPAAIKVLEHYRVSFERCDLLHLPAEQLERGNLFEDYVIVTRSENIFVDLAQTAVFTLHTAKPDAEPAPALLQLQEHLIASSNRTNNTTLHFMDRQLTELAERIAGVYGCHVIWFY
jgi:hypothetical protein